MTYVRIDTKDKYIYFENDTFICERYYPMRGKPYQQNIYRSQYTLKECYKCIRMTKKREIPNDKKVNVWYKKGLTKPIDNDILNTSK